MIKFLKGAFIFISGGVMGAIAYTYMLLDAKEDGIDVIGEIYDDLTK